MRSLAAMFLGVLAGCTQQDPGGNFILVMTTFNGGGVVTTQTVIPGFRSKEKCNFAGDQWHNSLPWNIRMPGNSDKDPLHMS